MSGSREELRSHVILRYTVTTFFVLLMVTLGLAQALSRRVTEDVIQNHVKIFPDLVRTTLAQHSKASAWFEQPPGVVLPAEAADFFTSLLQIPGIFRIKVWNDRGDVLWSDREELIGQNFAANPLLQKALAGEVAHSRKAADKEENRFETDARVVLEIYSPVISEGTVIGAIELYESDIVLEQGLARARRTVWLWTGGAGILLYGLLFLVFFQAHRRYRNAALQLIETQDVTIYALAYQSEMHDTETGNHLERTTKYVRLVAEQLSRGDRDRSLLTPGYIDKLVQSAPLHDIGKVAISDAILCKEGRLTPEEFEVMKRHSEYGASALRRAEEKLSFSSFLQTAVEIAHYHHERWDGQGYPAGLEGEKIPLAARIMALADIYDALRSRRRYKEPLPHEECRRFIVAEAGKALDPLVVEAFLQCEATFEAISLRLADG